MVVSRRVRLIAALVAILAVAGVLWTVSLRDDRVSTNSPQPKPVETWTRAATSPLSPRYDATVLWVDSHLFVGGGYDRGPCRRNGTDCAIVHPALRDGALYDPRSDTWQPIARAPSSIGTAVVAGDLLIAQTNAGLYVYDPQRDAWSPARQTFPELRILRPGRLTAIGNRFYSGYLPGTFGEIEPVQVCRVSTHSCRYLPVDRQLIRASLVATGLGPVWVGESGGGLFERGQVVVDVLTRGRWHRHPVSEARRLTWRVSGNGELVGRNGSGVARGVLRLPSGDWSSIDRAESAMKGTRRGFRFLTEAGHGWAVGHGEIVGPDLSVTSLGAPPGVRHRRDAGSVIAGDRLYVFGGYDGIDDRSADLWIRRLSTAS
jgi:hypothetical protein